MRLGSLGGGGVVRIDCEGMAISLLPALIKTEQEIDKMRRKCLFAHLLLRGEFGRQFAVPASGAGVASVVVVSGAAAACCWWA